ncbi:hypothetical protein LX32DRAFT_689549 [Colletotrichum zoysiae]|uniref:Uncharacterized protein n=1 Tax=Colletotrichum zoysiae TaxID=1216348 RepID=A0AAD9M8V4_9PEZI|nr:hypothetical protein LX32DRAFT_689549 [Colletotrichum zoysiae]
MRVSVVQLTGQEAWEPESVKEYPRLEIRNTSGYIATNWVNERCLEKNCDKCDPS